MHFLKYIGLTLFTLLCLVILSCKNDEGEINRITKVNNEPTETVNGLEIVYSDSAHIKARLQTPVMLRYYEKQPHTELPKGVKMFFYDNEAKETSTLTAKYAIRDELKKTLEARNDVVVRNAKGDQLNTEQLTYDERTGKYTSDAFVKITTSTEVIMGEGLEANQDFTKYKILHPKGNITINKEDSLK
ncbi:MAG: LPS export ABC transporter periplasmic protein LptC [Bacteroidia bacterium]